MRLSDPDPGPGPSLSKVCPIDRVGQEGQSGSGCTFNSGVMRV